jgi:hypothetical protein
VQGAGGGPYGGLVYVIHRMDRGCRDAYGPRMTLQTNPPPSPGPARLVAPNGRGASAVTEVVLSDRFNGPPGSAQGGYVCGTVAALLADGPEQRLVPAPGPVQVRLHRPPPLSTSLRWDGQRLLDGGDVVAEAAMPTDGTPVVPNPVSLEAAHEAAGRFLGRTRHPFPTCFGCGTRRPPGDGLRIFAAAVPGTTVLAAPWTPDPSLATSPAATPSESRRIPEAVVWAALDCPGGWAVGDDRSVVLGTMTAHVTGPIEVGAPHVVTAWPVGVEGRKRSACSALHSADGQLLAWSRQTWIELT